jgi:hypothetical protein
MCGGQSLVDDRQFDLVLPVSMGGEGSVLNALPTHAVCKPYRLNHRPGAVNTETRRLAGDADRE